jgi:predicted 3-demethylubiquinone-9 3-methyltransferase (glyoxalase superfamily)
VSISKIITFLWFDGEALPAAEFYVSLVPGSTITNVSRYLADAQRPEGDVLVVEFDLMGQHYAALNGGPEFPQSEAVSIQLMCSDQAEVDRLWDAIVGNGGAESMCGWCKDRWGVSWQIVPERLPELLGHPDPEVSGKAFRSMMTMRRIHVPTLEAAIAAP